MSPHPTARAALPLAGLLLVTLAAPAGEPNADERILLAAGHAVDAPSLVRFFQQRTLAREDWQRLIGRVRELGSESYDARQVAARDLISAGPPVRELLRRTCGDADLEIARRARLCLEQIERGPGPALPIAAARLLGARQSPDEAGTSLVAVLLRYLPFADDASVEAAVLDSLAELTARTATPAAELLAALDDSERSRRGAAGFVLGKHGERSARERARGLLNDPEASVRLRTAEGLLAGGDRAAIPVLIALVGDSPADVGGAADELLQRLADEQAPDAPIGEDSIRRRQRQAAWAQWWSEQGLQLDLARHKEPQRRLGLTLIPEMHAHRVWECAADGKPLWEISNLQCPIDAQALPDGRVLIAELHGQRVTERERSGRVVWQHAVNTPIGCQRLANGHTFIVTNHRVFTVAPDGKEVASYAPESGFFIHSAQRRPNGNVVLLSMAGGLREVDPAGKEIRTLTLPGTGGWSGVSALGGGRYLVVNNTEGRVAEIDSQGKMLWEHAQSGASHAARLPDGRILIVSNSDGVHEIDRAGRVHWRLSLKSSIWRAHRR